MKRVLFVMVALAGLPLGCLRADAPATVPVSVPLFSWFKDVTQQLGVDLLHDAGPPGDIHLLPNGGPKPTFGRTQVCSLHPAQSFLCSSEVSAHLGLGEANRVDNIDINRPDGSHEVLDKDNAVDQRLEVQ